MYPRSVGTPLRQKAGELLSQIQVKRTYSEQRSRRDKAGGGDHALSGKEAAGMDRSKWVQEAESYLTFMWNLKKSNSEIESRKVVAGVGVENVAGWVKEYKL